MVTRREFLELCAAVFAQNALDGGRHVGVVPFADAEQNPPFHTLMDEGLDARLYTDLSGLRSDSLVTPNDKFFVRTAFPDQLDASRPWSIDVSGLVRKPSALSLADLEPLVERQGPFVTECAGNSDPRNYGLMSAAEWAGAPFAKLLDRLQPAPGATRVRISGFDGHSAVPRSSLPGASWVFTVDQLTSAGAFLATQMNGELLPRNHGWPVRLLVPGWYGCTCIKWVNEIALVNDDEPATRQMREFAARTHQDGTPRLAREFVPAAMDLAALPVRIEKWLVSDRLRYRVIGIVWGGARVPQRLRIRFRSSEPFNGFNVSQAPPSPRTWGLWSYDWQPAAPGLYQIVLKPEEGIASRRLDLYFYTRSVRIDEV
ncbi:MAG TPA: molybdopterin-dependent oxidoreductase [Vicinamibacterales bacterium]|nr:molybdopterin-dependent oxidoreductase [Vicinamibacterales bacterium]